MTNRDPGKLVASYLNVSLDKQECTQCYTCCVLVRMAVRLRLGPKTASGIREDKASSFQNQRFNSDFMPTTRPRTQLVPTLQERP